MTKNEERFLVVRLTALGDILHTVPAVAALRIAHPMARIDWVVERKWAPVLEGSPAVLALMDSAPFADRPPMYVRAELYDYRFSDAATHDATGNWWVRRRIGLYFPQVSLADFGRAAAPAEAAP